MRISNWMPIMGYQPTARQLSLMSIKFFQWSFRALKFVVMHFITYAGCYYENVLTTFSHKFRSRISNFCINFTCFHFFSYFCSTIYFLIILKTFLCPNFYDLFNKNLPTFTENLATRSIISLIKAFSSSNFSFWIL